MSRGTCNLRWLFAACAALAVQAGQAAHGQWPHCPAPGYPPGYHPAPFPAYPSYPPDSRRAPGERPPREQRPTEREPGDGEQPPRDDAMPPLTDPGAMLAPTSTTAPPASALGFGQSIAGGGGFAAPANTYIDPAQVFTHFRLRFDGGFDNNVPDRAEFFYAKCGCFPRPDNPGPPLPERSLDFYDVRGYAEVATTENVSVFVELPFRFIDFTNNVDAGGFADMTAGFKTLLLSNGEDHLTFQLTTYIPTGDADRGLGTEHLSLEPALLFYEQHTDRLSIYGEGRYWWPIDGTNFAGDVVRYGVGTGYDLANINRGQERLTAITEIVGWTVLDGMKFDGGAFLDGAGAAAIQDASGDTIINLKLGLRYSLGLNSFAASWGHALTGDVWYENIARFEYRRAF
ncbi:MAG: hypothetical protein KY475_22335 [Planctomycetes bacterium]|nr:hypothetical protein [Planctomycetota bacterium]